jgi:fatty-acyl-CoA synthase
VLIGSPADPLDEREVGEVLLKGPSLMRGYLGGDDEDPFVDGWFRTGDLGYLAEGELFLTGRTKDVIIAWGRNYAPEDIEWAAGRVPGVRSGRCVAFGPTGGREGEVVVVVEARPEADPASLPSLVRAAVTDAVGLVPKDVLVVPNGTVPKTTSGKLRRSALRTAHADGSLLGAAIARLR